MISDLENLILDYESAKQKSKDDAFEYIDCLEKNYKEEDLTQMFSSLISKEQDSDLLIYLIKKINKIKYPEMLDILLDLLLITEKRKEDSPNKYNQVRVFAIKAIANFKDTKAVLPLLYCLNNKHEDYKIRLSCAEALGKIGDKYAVTPLIDVVSDEEEKSVYIKESAVKALGMLGDERAMDPLLAILETKRGILDKFTFLKERVLEALSNFNFCNDRMFKALRNSLVDESPQIRINAIEALMNTSDERAIPLIKKMLLDKDEDVVRNSVIAIYNLEGKSALLEILESETYTDFCKEEAQTILDEYETEQDE